MLPVITLIEMIGFADVAALLVTGIHCIESGSQRLQSGDKQWVHSCLQVTFADDEGSCLLIQLTVFSTVGARRSSALKMDSCGEGRWSFKPKPIRPMALSSLGLYQARSC